MDCPNVSFEVDPLTKQMLEYISKKMNVSQSEFLRNILDFIFIKNQFILRGLINDISAAQFLDMCNDIEIIINNLKQGGLSNEGREKILKLLYNILNKINEHVPIGKAGFWLIPSLFFMKIFNIVPSTTNLINLLKKSASQQLEIEKKIEDFVHSFYNIYLLNGDVLISLNMIINDILLSLPESSFLTFGFIFDSKIIQHNEHFQKVVKKLQELSNYLAQKIITKIYEKIFEYIIKRETLYTLYKELVAIFLDLLPPEDKGDLYMIFIIKVFIFSIINHIILIRFTKGFLIENFDQFTKHISENDEKIKKCRQVLEEVKKLLEQQK